MLESKPMSLLFGYYIKQDGLRDRITASPGMQKNKKAYLEA
jgi:hypothetical protein